MRAFFAFASFATLSFFGCAASESIACRVGADCASGICGGDGTCAAPASGTDAGGMGEGGPTDGGSSDGPVTSNDGQAPGDGGICAPNNDGVITSAEAPFGPGLHATFLVAQNVTVDTAGVANPDGTRTWDYTGALAGDQKILIDTEAPAGKWFSSDFPTASYTARLSATTNLLGVFKTVPNALQLLGVVTPDTPDAGAHTEITYATPITTLAFPLQKAATWTTTSNVTATVSGIPTAYVETYTSTVDATGTLKTPFGTFKVQRVSVVLVRAFTITIRTFVFMTECFTTVARVVSNTNETTAEFTTASEIQRLSP